MTHAFTSHRIVTPGGIRPGALLVEFGVEGGAAGNEDQVDGRIRAICNLAEIPAGARRHACGDHAILPGLVDTHVHINEPGRTEWEGFATATRAAAAGGYTTLVDMPLNCLPETTTVAALDAKRRAARGQTSVDWAAWGGAVSDNQQHLLPLAQAGVPGFKCFLIYPGCEGFSMVQREELEAALPAIAASGLPLLVHAELPEPMDAVREALATADWRCYATYLASRPDEAELGAIRLLILLCRQYRFRLHIVHLSSALALPELARAREEGLPVTVETCPHYLYFAAEEIPDGATLLKCAPPIRSRGNREALWRGLADGTIDLVATDHSPCLPAMKLLDRGRFDLAWGGIASLSVALSAMHTEGRRRGHTLLELARWMSSAPAHLAGIDGRAGALAAGREANFVIFDTEATVGITAEHLRFRHPVSPYVGETLHGRVEATYLRGRRIWNGASFDPTPRGREIRLC